MQPLDEFRDQLFLSAGGTAERLTEFSCGHVIPPENILPIALTAGPSGKQLDFSYQSRTLPVMVSLRAALEYVKCSQSNFLFLICCAIYVY
jgi:chromosome transmission fidelity protein 1